MLDGYHLPFGKAETRAEAAKIRVPRVRRPLVRWLTDGTQVQNNALSE